MDLFAVAPSSIPRRSCVNSQLPVGIFLVYVLFQILFIQLQCPHLAQQCQIHLTLKYIYYFYDNNYYYYCYYIIIMIIIIIIIIII